MNMSIFLLLAGSVSSFIFFGFIGALAFAITFKLSTLKLDVVTSTLIGIACAAAIVIPFGPQIYKMAVKQYGKDAAGFVVPEPPKPILEAPAAAPAPAATPAPFAIDDQNTPSSAPEATKPHPDKKIERDRRVLLAYPDAFEIVKSEKFYKWQHANFKSFIDTDYIVDYGTYDEFIIMMKKFKRNEPFHKFKNGHYVD